MVEGRRSAMRPGCRTAKRAGIRDAAGRTGSFEGTAHGVWERRSLVTTRSNAHEFRGATAASVMRTTKGTVDVTTCRASEDDWTGRPISKYRQTGCRDSETDARTMRWPPRSRSTSSTRVAITRSRVPGISDGAASGRYGNDPAGSTSGVVPRTVTRVTPSGHGGVGTVSPVCTAMTSVLSRLGQGGRRRAWGAEGAAGSQQLS